MKLNRYLKTLPPGGQTEFAAAARISQAYLSQISTGVRGCSAEVALRIERASKERPTPKGEFVTAEELRPQTDWPSIRGAAEAV